MKTQKYIIMALALGICSASAITYEFNGKIDRVVDALDPYGIRVGTPFHGYLSFDLETLIPSISFKQVVGAVGGRAALDSSAAPQGGGCRRMIDTKERP